MLNADSPHSYAKSRSEKVFPRTLNEIIKLKVIFSSALFHCLPFIIRIAPNLKR